MTCIRWQQGRVRSRRATRPGTPPTAENTSARPCHDPRGEMAGRNPAVGNIVIPSADLDRRTAAGPDDESIRPDMTTPAGILRDVRRCCLVTPTVERQNQKNFQSRGLTVSPAMRYNLLSMVVCGAGLLFAQVAGRANLRDSTCMVSADSNPRPRCGWDTDSL